MKKKLSEDWTILLQKQVEDREFATLFIKDAVKDGIPLEEILAKVVRLIGIQKFADEIGMEVPNLIRALNPDHNPTKRTLDRLLVPFGLTLTVAPIRKRKTLKRSNASAA